MRVRQTGLFLLMIVWAMLAFASPVLGQTPDGARSVREVNAFETSCSPFIFSNKHDLVWQFKVHEGYWHAWPCLSSSSDVLISDRWGLRMLSPNSGHCQVYIDSIQHQAVRIEPTDAGTIFCTVPYDWDTADTQADKDMAAVVVLTDNGKIITRSHATDWYRTYPAYCGGNDVALGIPLEGVQLLQAATGTMQTSLKLPNKYFCSRIATDGAGRLSFMADLEFIAARTDGSIEWQTNIEDLYDTAPPQRYLYGNFYPYRSTSSDLRAFDISDGPYYSPSGQLIFRFIGTDVFAMDLQGKIVWWCEGIAENARNIVLNEQGTLFIGPDYTIWNISPDGTYSMWFRSTEFTDLAAAHYKEDPAKSDEVLYLLQDSTGALLVALCDRLFLVNAAKHVVWRVTLPDNISARPLLLPDGNIVTVCENGTVWCIGTHETADTGGAAR